MRLGWDANCDTDSLKFSSCNYHMYQISSLLITYNNIAHPEPVNEYIVKS